MPKWFKAGRRSYLSQSDANAYIYGFELHRNAKPCPEWSPARDGWVDRACEVSAQEPKAGKLTVAELDAAIAENYGSHPVVLLRLAAQSSGAL